MRITAFDHEQGEFCGMDVQARRLAALPDPLKAAYWKMLLDLVTHLQSSDSEHEQGFVLPDGLHLSETEPPNSIRDSQIRQFMIDWRQNIQIPQKAVNLEPRYEAVSLAIATFILRFGLTGMTTARLRTAFPRCTFGLEPREREALLSKMHERRMWRRPKGVIRNVFGW